MPKTNPFLDWESFFSFSSRAVFSDESVLTLSLRAFSSISSGDWTLIRPSASCKTKRSEYYSIYSKSTRSIRLLTSSSLTISSTFSLGKLLPDVTWEALATTSVTALLGTSSIFPTVFHVTWESKGRTCHLNYNKGK